MGRRGAEGPVSGAGEWAICAHERAWPHLTSRGLGARCAPAGARVLAGLFGAFALAPEATLAALIGLAGLVHLADAAFKLRLAAAGFRPLEPASLARDDAELPLYTLLLPLYREAAMLPSLMAAIDALDYPADKLDVKLVIEADDLPTLDAAERLVPGRSCEIIRVPPSLPRTKPKALNAALPFARGELLAIYDAEDRPEPDQLRKAVAAFRRGGPRLACLQARLAYRNAYQNWLTGQFEIEYAQWFEILLPGLARLALPIPLGGTSNHLRTDVLRALSGWDPYNVTEDAELGLRLAEAGWHVDCLDSTTYEEATASLGPWISQRTRWIKGYLQTFLVRLIAPARPLAAMGAHAFLAAQLFLGGRLVTALVNPLLWLGFLAGLALAAPTPEEDAVVPLAAGLFGANFFILALSAVVPWRRRAWRLLALVPTVPLYWVLAAVAGYRALFQFFLAPYLWEKTPHVPPRA